MIKEAMPKKLRPTPTARQAQRHLAMLHDLATKREKHGKVRAMLESARDADRRLAAQQELSQLYSHLAGHRPIQQQLLLGMGHRIQALEGRGIHLPRLPAL